MVGRATTSTMFRWKARASSRRRGGGESLDPSSSSSGRGSFPPRKRWEELRLRNRRLQPGTDATSAGTSKDVGDVKEETIRLRKKILDGLKKEEAYAWFATLRRLSGRSAVVEHYISGQTWDEEGLWHDLKLAIRRSKLERLREVVQLSKEGVPRINNIGEEVSRIDAGKVLELRNASLAAQKDARIRSAASEFEAKRSEEEKERYRMNQESGNSIVMDHTLGRSSAESQEISKVLEEAWRRQRARNLAALELERQEEKDSRIKEQRRWSLKKLQGQGLVLAGVRASLKGQLFRDAVVELSMPGNVELPHHKFVQGDNIALRPLDGKLKAKEPSLHREWTLNEVWREDSEETERVSDVVMDGDLLVEGIVLEIREKSIQITVPSGFARELRLLPFGTLWRLDRGSNSETYRRAVDAVQRLGTPRTGSAGERNIQLILAADEEFPKLCDPAKSSALAPAIPSIAQPGWKQRAMQHLSSLDLNHSQKSAVQVALSSSMTLWQGPPGTGKTRTLLGFIEVLCSLHLKGPILASSGTNAAVDNIVEGLLARGINVVRMGQPAKIRANVRQASLEALIAQTSAGREAMKLRNEAEVSIFKGIRTDREESLHLEARAQELNARALALEQAATKEVLEKVQVVAATCAGAGESRLMHHNFRIVVLDEATQATEPQCIIPLTKGAECVVMAGDPRQLPPTVMSQAAQNAGLGVTLFEKIQKVGIEPHLLDTQYRMHSLIQEFPSRMFYENRLKSGISDSERPPPGGFPWPRAGKPVCFVNCTMGKESQVEGGTSFQNIQEAQLVISILQKVIQRGELQGTGGSAILTPYAGQVRLLKTVAASMDGFTNVEISSIDGFQGRETELVVFSAVRSNARQAVGFLADARRLNVAITRAKRGLIVVGNSDTLKSDPTWQAWLEWAEGHGLIVEESQINSSPITLHGSSYTLSELQNLARERGLRGFSKLRKGQLLELLMSTDGVSS